MVNWMVRLKKRLSNSIRHRLLAGILLFLPFGVTLLRMRWLFSWLEGSIRPTARGCLSGIDRIALFDPIRELYLSISPAYASPWDMPDLVTKRIARPTTPRWVQRAWIRDSLWSMAYSRWVAMHFSKAKYGFTSRVWPGTGCLLIWGSVKSNAFS